MNAKNVIVSIAIAVLLAFFVGYGIEVFDSVSDRNDCYANEYRLYNIYSEDECLQAGGVYVKEPFVEMGKPVAPPDMAGHEEKVEEVIGRCTSDYEAQQRCYTEYEASKQKHDVVVFIVGVVFGILAILYGILLKTSAIGSGVLFVGLILVVYGTVRYWRYADNILKFILLGIALAALVWFAYKNLDKNK